MPNKKADDKRMTIIFKMTEKQRNALDLACMLTGNGDNRMAFIQQYLLHLADNDPRFEAFKDQQHQAWDTL